MDVKRQSSGKKKILLVDDDAGVMDVCTQMLQHHGYEVTTSISGEEAIDIFYDMHFDLVILDMGLPGIDGLSCAKEMRKQKNDVKIVISSGNCSDVLSGKESPCNCFHILQKPFTMSELICAVSNAMGRC